MMNAVADSTAGVPHRDPRLARRMLLLFALAYFAQATSQMGGLISQPLNFYLKTGLGLNPAQVSEYLAIASFPWMIKPLYGLISDYVPLLGYRRKSWLMLMNLLAASGFLWLAGLSDPGTLIAALTLTAFGTAAADVIIDALMVEKGAETGLTGRFLGTQWLFFKLAAVMTALAGGHLAASFEPDTALHVAATFTLAAPLALLAAAYFLVDEPPAHLDLAEARATTRALWQAIASRDLRLAATFLALWCFSPGFGAPLYFHMVDNLGFQQAFIGQLGAATAVGGALGALVFARVLSEKRLTFQANFAIAGAILAVLGHLSLAQPSALAQTVAVPLHVGVGLLNQIGALTVFAIVARACPPRAAGFAFAAMMSIYNGVEQFSNVIGSHLYEHGLGRELAPLLWIAAGSLALCFMLVPRLAHPRAGGEPGQTG